ncbi:MAG: hypothetical protein IAX21_06595 [Candidatus Bathyarchaeota archaeon]|nr:MAG: hypothetical protein IAX21_06595 [Candidatus Bathyarchaeota archaeon]
MKKWTRIGVIILLIGISLLLVTLIRNSVDRTTMSFNGFQYPEYFSDSQSPSIWAPRDLTLIVDVDSPIDIYILDEEGIKLWLKDETIEPFLSYTNVEQNTLTSRIEHRNRYAYLIHNQLNSTINGKITIRFTGPEQDLLQSSEIAIGAGLSIITASLIIQIANNKKHKERK